MLNHNKPTYFKDGLPSNIPFCFQGEEVTELRRRLRLSNFPFNNSDSHYGYKFCTRMRHTLTDIGICTTFNGADVFGDKNEELQTNSAVGG